MLKKNIDQEGTVLVIVLSVIAVIALLGGSFYWYINSRVQPVQPENIQNTPIPTPTTTGKTTRPKEFLHTNLSKDWSSYTNSKYDFLRFLYPEGATINFEEDTENQIDGCFSLTLKYQEMTMEVDRLCGIGGRPSLYDSPYTIVAGNDYAGVGKVVENDTIKNQKAIHYFGYREGAQQFGGFLVNTAGFNFKIPSSSQAKYEPVADMIATSVLNTTPNEQEIPAKIYKREYAVIGVNPDRTEYTIFKSEVSKKERVETATINPTGEYLAITTFVDTGPDSYMYFYSLSTRSLLKFGEQSRFPTIGDPEIWVENFAVVDADLNGRYKYDVKKLTKTSIIYEEYDKYQNP